MTPGTKGLAMLLYGHPYSIPDVRDIFAEIPGSEPAVCGNSFHRGAIFDAPQHYPTTCIECNSEMDVRRAFVPIARKFRENGASTGIVVRLMRDALKAYRAGAARLAVGFFCYDLE